MTEQQEAIAVEKLRRLFLLFGRTQCRGHSAVYEALSEQIAGNDGLLRLLLHAQPDQRRPSLLFAAVNRVLASNIEDRLAEYYPIHGGQRRVDDALSTALSDFCEIHRDELAKLLREQSTQTNEIRRCVALRLGLGHVQRSWPGPIALVEVGASAGLNLLFDHYRYRLSGRETGGGTSSVVVACEVRGSSPERVGFGLTPTITSRLGVDLNPIDLSDAVARAWLEAFIWPEQVEELMTLRGAVGLALSAAIATTIRGEATRDISRMLTDLPGREPVLVFTASLLSYLDPEARTAFAAQLRKAAGMRPVAWVFAEAPGLLATTDLRIPTLAGALAQNTSQYLVGASMRGSGLQNDQLLALADPYLRWIAPARQASDDFQWAVRQPSMEGREPEFNGL